MSRLQSSPANMKGVAYAETPCSRPRGGMGVRVTIKNSVAAAELVKHDQAQCFDDLGGRLYIREAV
jgi:hypothetical protein